MNAKTLSSCTLTPFPNQYPWHALMLGIGTHTVAPLILKRLDFHEQVKLLNPQSAFLK